MAFRKACYFYQVIWLVVISPLVLASFCGAQSFGEEAKESQISLRVSVSQNPPLNFTDASGRPAGVFVDLLNEVARQEHWLITYVPCEFMECQQAVLDHGIDLVSDFAFTRERDFTFDYHVNPIVDCWTQLYVSQSIEVSNFFDLDGKKILFLKGSVHEDDLRNYLRGFGIKATLIPIKTNEDGFKMVEKGLADGIIVSQFVGESLFSKYGLKSTAIIFQPMSLFYASAQGRHANVLNAIDHHLQKWQKESNSFYYQTLNRWLYVRTTEVIPRYLVVGLFFVIGCLLVAGGGVFWLRYQVRKRTENLIVADESLRKSEEKYRNLFKTMEQGVIYENAYGSILSANPAAIKLLGLAEDPVNKCYTRNEGWNIVRGDGSPYPVEEQPDAVALRTGVPVQGILMGIVHSGSNQPVWLLVDAKPIVYPGDHIASEVYLTLSDVTLQKRVEQQEHQWFLELDQLFSAMPEAVIYCDLDRRIIKVNSAFTRIFGYESHELLGQNTCAVYERSEDYIKQGQERYNADAASNYTPFEVSYKKKNGDCFIGETTSSIIHTSDGHPLGMLGLIRDVTENRKLEDQLNQSKKMESVGRLAGGVAHDFNNILNVLMGYAELALTKLTPDNPLHGDVTEILKAGQRSKEITRQLLAFASKQPILPTALDLNVTVEGMLKMLRRLIGENIELCWLPGPFLGMVKMDPSQVNQIMVNLCVNARDAITDVGRIVIQTSCEVIAQDAIAEYPEAMPGEYMVLSVRDNGNGMDSDTQKKVFEPFFTTKELGRGTGLGLATVYGIVKQNAGFIRLESKPGQGTCFRIYIPRYVRESVEVTIEKNEEVIALAQGETIFVVEDDSAILQMVEKLLKSLNYTVLTANIPSEAIQRMEEYTGKIDLLLTDVIMPKMNGRDIAMRLQHMQPGLRCLFMSGYPEDVIAMQGVLEPGIHLIQKPFTIQELATSVRAALA